MQGGGLEEFSEACVLPLTDDGAPISMTLFDPSEELIWSVSGSGMIYSHMLPTAEPYSAFRADAAGGAYCQLGHSTPRPRDSDVGREVFEAGQGCNLKP